MKKIREISGIICEFNPLHKGHQLILDHAAAFQAPVVCVLSGNFVQRGEPAILDKWSRTRLALESGANLVIELPLPWAMAGAERFAAGAVHLLSSLGTKGRLVFGSEAGEVTALWKTAAFLLSPEFSVQVEVELQTGISFARARQQAVSRLLGEPCGTLLEAPNNILAVEYLKALINSNASLTPHTICRQGAGHDSTAQDDQLRSARELRVLLLGKEDVSPYIPPRTGALIENLTARGRCPASADKLESAVLAKLRTMSTADFSALPDISEGLENRIYQAVRSSCSLSALFDAIKSKRYSHARVRRLVYAAFLGLTADMPPLPPYLRVLGMDKTGEALIRSPGLALPLVVRAGDVPTLSEDAQRVFALEARADDLYALSLPSPMPCGADYTTPVVKI